MSSDTRRETSSTGSTMPALRVDEPGRIVLTQVPRLEEAPPGWVLVDVAAAGICGTDYHIFEGKHPFLAYPRVIGHELSGRIAADAEGFRAGTLVTINPYIACGRCRACRRGKPNCCVAIEVLGVHRDGGITGRIAVPAGNLYAADGLTPAEAAMIEFLAIGAHAVRRSRTGPGERAIVVGAGPIGLGTALFAREAGAEVHLLDLSPQRLAMARERFGFESSFQPSAKGAAAMAATGGEGFDVVFDATGNAASIENCFPLVAHGGSLVLVSVVKGDIRFSDAEFHKREMSIIGSRNATAEDFDTVRRAFAEKRIDAARLHTDTASLAEAAERLPAWAADRDGVIKAIVEIST